MLKHSIAQCDFKMYFVYNVYIYMRLGADICEPHTCPCGSYVDSRGTHGMSCRSSAGRQSRHAQINDLVWRSLSRANIPSTKEPKGLFNSDERRPDGITFVPWSKGKCLTWDATVADTYAQTYLPATSVKAGAWRKCWRSTNQRNTATSSSTIYSALLPLKPWGRSMRRA